MKKVLIIVMVLWSMNAFATSSHICRGNSCNTENNYITNNEGGDALAISGSKANATAISVTKQGQQQGQVQGQQQISVGYVGGDTYTVEKPYMNAPNLVGTEVNPIQGGRVGDFTGAIPYVGLTPYKGEKVIKVIAVYSGSIFWRIRLEDVVSTIIEKGAGLKGNVRYMVLFKDSVTSGCVGIPLAGASSHNGMAGSVSGTNSYCQSTANPQFIIQFFEVE